MVKTSTLPLDALPDRTLHRVTGSSSLRGFTNILANEQRRWWGTQAWLYQLAAWLGIINGLIALVAYGETQDVTGLQPPLIQELLQVFFKAGGMAIAIGVVIAAQSALVGEKQLGTAAWLLSKPVGRNAFVLAKLTSYFLVFLALAIVVPSLVFFVEAIIAAGQTPALVPFLQAQGMMLLHFTFYFALTFALGAWASSRGVVSGGAFIFLFGGMILPNFMSSLGMIFPWHLGEFAARLSMGAALPEAWIVPVICTAVWTLLLSVATLWRFAREEF